MTRNTCHIQRVSSTLFFLSVVAAGGQAQVRVTGHISDQASGTPVAGLAMSVMQLPSAASLQPQVFRTTSGTDGSYSLDVSPGSYRVCTEEVQGYLDPCQWRLGSTDFVVPAVAVQTVRDVTLQKGRNLVVRIMDSTGSLTAARPVGVAAPALSISVVDSVGKTRVIPFRKTVGPVHEFALLVPLASYNLHVSSPVVNLVGPDGTPLSSAGYNNTVDASVVPPALPPWLPLWLANPSEQASTIVALRTVGTPGH